MKFALAKEHREFYAHHHFIEFENILSPEEIDSLCRLIKETLKKSATKRDLWRQNPEIQKIILKRCFAEIAKELFKQPLIRIAFDQYQESFSPLSLTQMSCVRPIIGAIAVPIQENSSGKAIYFSPTTPFTLPFCNEPLLIIAYTGSKAQYILTESDPHTHTLKKIGYTFGDHIKSETHPIIIK
jgi:hypothetical protein